MISEVKNIDCMIAMPEFPDKFFDLAVVDPPYGIKVAKMAYTQEENRPCKQKNGSVLRVKKLGYKHGDWDNEIPSDGYFYELFRVSKNQIIWGINYFNLSNIGGGRIKWNKGQSEGVSFNTYEYSYCSLEDNEVQLDLLWAGMCQAKSLREPMTQQGNKKLNEKRIHPTQKPALLYSWILKNYAKQGDKILDTHLGSGSSRIAAHKAGLDFWGYELDADYFAAQEKRFKNYKSQMTLQF